MRRSSRALAVALALTAVMLAGCAATPTESAPMPSSSSSAPAAASPTSEPAPAGVILDGSCDALLDATTVAELLGEAPTVREDIYADDPAVLGGLTCAWHGSHLRALHVTAFPASVVPADLLSSNLPTECDPYSPCYAWKVVGDIWVQAAGLEAEEVTRAVNVAAAGLEGTAAPEPRATGADRWTVPSCDEVKVALADARQGTVLSDYAGDSFPSGPYWDVMTANGVAGWCAWFAEGNGSLTEQFEVYPAPGNPSGADVAIRAGWEPIEVAGASAGAYRPADGEAQRSSMIIASVGENSIGVTARFLDQAQLVALTEAMLAVTAGG